MSHPLVVLDIDGTICENGHRIDWSNPLSVRDKCRPIKLAQARIAVMYAKGWMPWFLTARYAWTMSGVTMRQLREWLPDGLADAAEIDLWDVPRSEYGSAEAFLTGMVMFKAVALENVASVCGGVGVYVGDRPEDREAAKLAGWRFMWAHDWRAGQPFVVDGEPLRRAESSGEICTVLEGESGRVRTEEVSSAQGVES